MKLRRPRLTLRNLMVIVAIAAVLFAIPGMVQRTLDRRRHAFNQRAIAYSEMAAANGCSALSYFVFRRTKPRTEAERLAGPTEADIALNTLRLERGDYFLGLANKYREASRRPWMPLWPDPPEPVVD